MSLVTQALLIDQFIGALANIRRVLTALLEDAFTAPKSWREGEDVDRFVNRAVPLVEGAQRAAATLTEDFLTRIIADQTGEPYRPRGADLSKLTGAAVRNGVAPEAVYARPFQEVWSSLAEDRRRTERVARVERNLSAGDAPTRLVNPKTGREIIRPNGKPLTEAVGRGQRRAKLLGLTDVELAVTHAVQDRLADEPRYKYYRRVLTGAENCGLCVVASTQRYRKRDLMPIHPACDCVVAPILGDVDPGHIINTKRVAPGVSPTGETRSGVPVFSDDQLLDLGELLEDAHRAVEETFGFAARDARLIDYRKVVTVVDHSEMGPLVSVTGHRFSKRRIREGDLAARGR